MTRSYTALSPEQCEEVSFGIVEGLGPEARVHDIYEWLSDEIEYGADIVNAVGAAVHNYNAIRNHGYPSGDDVVVSDASWLVNIGRLEDRGYRELPELVKMLEPGECQTLAYKASDDIGKLAVLGNRKRSGDETVKEPNALEFVGDPDIEPSARFGGLVIVTHGRFARYVIDDEERTEDLVDVLPDAVIESAVALSHRTEAVLRPLLCVGEGKLGWLAADVFSKAFRQRFAIPFL